MNSRETLEVTQADAEILRGEPDPLTVLVDGIVIEDDDEPIGTAYMGDVLEDTQGFDINTLKELTLTTKQALWLLSRNFGNDDEWTSPEVGDTYQENVDLKIQIAVTNAAEVRISTWQ